MVDIHCHIIPEVDDGAPSWDVAVEMCQMAFHDGIEHIVATPHADFQYAYDRQALAARLERLQQLAGGLPRLTLGCDFHLSYDNLEDAFAHPQRYTIGDTGYLLVEFSDYSIPQQITGALLRLIEMGITPVITHPERNPLLQHDVDRLLQWIDDGCLVQITANSLTGYWGEQARRSARALLQQQAVHVLATDAHDNRRRVPILSAARNAVALWHGEERARALVEDNPRAIISGEKVRASSARAGH
jgi:protein-tyrosine phosphatase